MAMAFAHPTEGATTPRPSSSNRLHPCLGLVGGFGLIVVGALAVHVVFNALI
jgi:hypothetical protein